MRFAVLVSALLLAWAGMAGEKPALRLEQTIDLPGLKGRFDHLAIDQKAHRLFVAAAENNTLEVINLSAGKRVQSISGMAKPAGVLYLPEAERLLVANEEDATIRILNGATLKEVKTIYSILDSDNLRVEPGTGAVFVGFGNGAIGMLDKDLMSLVRYYRVHGHPESFQFETNSPRAFVNVPASNYVAVVDCAKKKMVESWPLGEFHDNYPMALDETDGRLLVGCRKPPELVVFDTANGKQVAHVGIARDCDDLFFDAKRKRIYAACGEGFISCLVQVSPNQYDKLSSIETVEGARTGLFDPQADRFYLATPANGNTPAQVRVYQPE